MFDIILHTFSKKENSTARPSGGTSFNCMMKDESGIINPTVVLENGASWNPRTYNYAQIPSFDRYYYINEWTFNRGVWIASLKVDALASWKQTIGSSNCYVLRSSSEYDLEVMDRTYPALNTTTSFKTELTSPWSVGNSTDGTYVVGVAGQSTTYYIFTPSQLETFLNFLMSDDYVNALVDGWATVFPQIKAQTNPLQFITSIKWFPFKVTGNVTNMLRVGFVDVETGVSELAGSGTFSSSIAIVLPRHPQSVRGSYLNNSPFSTYSLFFPPWGNIQLDPDMIANSASIIVSWIVDLRTGGGTLTVKLGSDASTIVTWVHSMVAVEQQVTQIINKGYGVGNIIQPLTSVIGSAVGGPAAVAGSAIVNGIGAIGDMASSSIPSATSIGSVGGIDSLMGNPTAYFNFKTVADEDLTHRGRPLCKNRTISTLSGYILVADADIDIPCSSSEYSEIKSFMEGGFFYE